MLLTLLIVGWTLALLASAVTAYLGYRLAEAGNLLEGAYAFNRTLLSSVDSLRKQRDHWMQLYADPFYD